MDHLLDRSPLGAAAEAPEAPRGATPAGPLADPVTPALREELLAEIVADARRAPEAYLRESVVPEGGE